MTIKTIKNTKKKNRTIKKNSIDKRDDGGYTPLHRAILGKSNTIEMMIHLLRKGASVNKTDHDGNNALHLAVLKRDMNKVSYILRYSPEISKKNADGNTPLHIATMNEDINIIYALLSKGGCYSSKMQNEDGKTPLSIAESANNPNMHNIAIYIKNMCYDGPMAASGSNNKTRKNKTKKNKK